MTNGTSPNGAIGVYVHFPWCLKKCPYCDFLSVASERRDIPHRAYADCVIAELERRAPPQAHRQLRSVFFGGGTPSLWQPAELGRVLAAILGAFSSGSVHAEVTVECNPTSLDPERVEQWAALGANRLSIGVQSLDAGQLTFLGRLHDQEQGLQAVRQALDSHLRVSADLIFGLPGQPPAQARAEALRVAELGVTHLSAYALTIEPNTQFGALARQGRLPLATEESVAESFLALDEALTGVGFDHYEISNYARSGHVAEHNLGYWTGRDYLGLGAGAWGTVARTRYRNTPSVPRYLESRDRWRLEDLERTGPDSLLAAIEPIDAQTALREKILLGLRLKQGLDIEAVASELEVEPWPRSRELALARLLERGRIARDGTRWFIPPSQWLLSDATIAELL
ncbi:MAG TPA: radical SAM family heme chaperone HemW [Polyangiaceae bacterium]